ncbi:MAG: YhfC family glutamic-type intramembrane protease [Oscillospiraceae bacterium]|nr:YhfC family glutamic-type intramembrane protease [Oscillospiraceae bacterium]
MYFISCLFAVLCSIVLPAGAAALLCLRERRLVKPLLLGAGTFLVFQVLLRLPLIQLVLPKAGWYAVMSALYPGLYALFLGCTAALFEELGRFLVMRRFLRSSLRTADALAFGVGHGGIEAVLLVGINSVALLFSPLPLAAPSLMFAAGVERLCTLVFHVCWSVMIMRAVRGKKPLWLALALLTHAALDTGAALASFAGVGVWYIELALAVCAAPAALFVINEFRKEKKQ